ncbi:hypothetical protein SteCoe_20217 [Stentor coeruleus]|uniref:TmcB/TmcC TPR repeats domain-containing protein n=1 Tax=Stentor coeruleus TaxID=5963 RepID=A0A1R2AWM6_9CILI|nr:hypothetical protein SteCoe_33471 [Stentor coeruleus]OMJ79698.1 hypothetical protein SteCoe_20217 [Stentor coeruleus]
MKSIDNTNTKGLQNIAQGLTYQNSSFSFASIQKNAKETLFKTMLKLFSYHYETFQISKLQVIMFYIMIIIQTLHLSSLLYFPTENIKYWDSFKVFWTILGYMRFDNICSTFSILPTCFYLSISLISFQVLCLALFVIFHIIPNKEGPFLSKAIRKLYLLMSSYLYIPILCITLLYMKYSIIHSDHIPEYNVFYTDLKINSSVPVIIICILCHYINSFFYAAFCNENRHTFARFCYESKSHTKIDKIRLHFITSLIVFYAFFGVSNKEIYCGICSLGCLIMALGYFKYQPYFSNHANVLQIGSYTCVSCIALAFELSFFTNNASYAFVISLFVIPMIVGIVMYKAFEYLSQNVLRVGDAKTIYEFEKALRPLLSSEEFVKNFEEIISAFSEAYKDKNFGKNPMMVVWLTNYCFYTLEDDSLTRIKMGTETDSDSNLDSDYQLFCLRETIKKGGLEYREDIDYLNFRFKLENVKLNDEHLCISLLEFLRQMSTETNFKYLLSKLIPSVSHLLSQVSGQYQSLISKYPKSAAILDLYSSFLNEIINHDDKALELKRKKEHLLYSNNQGNLKSISYFDEENALIIISGARESFSIITFANEKTGKILRQPVNTIIGNSISSYVPYPFNVGHNQHMYRFLVNCSNSDIKLPLGLFLQTHIGYLVECYIQIRCTALDSSPFFIVLMKERKTKREIGIISATGSILNHSEGFPAILGENSLSLKDMNIDNYLEGHKFLELEENYPTLIQKENSKIAVIRSFKVIKNKKVHLAYILTDQNEISAWLKGKFLNETEYNNKQRMDMTITCDEGQTDRNHLIEYDNKINTYPDIITLQKVTPTSENRNEISSTPNEKTGFQIKTIANSSKNNNKNEANHNSLACNPRFKIVLIFLQRYKYISCGFLFIVLSIQVAIMIIIYKIYIIENIQDMVNIAETSSLLSEISFLSRGMFLITDDPMPRLNNLLDFQLAYTNLTIQKYNIKDVMHISNCDMDKIFPIEKYIEINTANMGIKNKPVLDIIQDILISMQSYINKKDQKLLNFIILNSIITSDNLHRSYQELEKCKTDHAKNRYNIIGYFVLCSVFLSGISALFIMWGMMKINKHYSVIWKTFCSLASSRTYELRKRIIDRLIDVHKKIEYNSDNDYEKNSPKVVMKIGLFMYVWRFATYAIFLLGFYGFLYLFTMPKMHKIIEIQPMTLRSVYDEHKLVNDLNFWIREIMLEENVTSFDKVFDKMVMFDTPRGCIEEIVVKIKESLDYCFNDELHKFITQKTIDRLFKEDFGMLGGVYGMINDIIMVSYDISSTNRYMDPISLQNKFDLFHISITSFSTLIEDDLSNELWQVKNVSIIFTAVYSIFSFILFTMIFNFMLHENEEKIKDIQKLGEFIPAKAFFN